MSGEAKAALIGVLGFAGVARDEVDDWYDLEHFPQRLAVPGVVAAERWLASDGSEVSVAVYELASLDVLHSAPYLAISGPNQSPWSRRILGKCAAQRYEAELTLRLAKPDVASAEGMLLVGMNVAPDAEAEFDRWYDEEHVPGLFALPGVLGARRYRAVAGGQKHFALYHLASPEVQASPAWATAINTPWASRVRPRTRDRVRWVCRRYRRTPA